MDEKLLEKVEADEKKVRAFLKEVIACCRHMSKYVEVPYPELVALVEHAKENPRRYLEVKEMLHK